MRLFPLHLRAFALLTVALVGLRLPAPASAGNRVVAWGVTGYGYTNTPAAATNVTAIAAGNGYSLAFAQHHSGSN